MNTERPENPLSKVGAFLTLAHYTIAVCFLLLFISGCQVSNQCIEPCIVYNQPPCFVKNLPSPFSPLTKEEYRFDWAKELLIASTFANELDFYRAITSYKRALILMPEKYRERRMQAEYGILEAYYIAGKYQDVLDTFEPSDLLTNVSNDFPAIDDLLIMVYDSYQETGQEEKACKILTIIESRNADKAYDLQVSEAIIEGNIPELRNLTACDDGAEYVTSFLASYESSALSVRRAQVLNALLPGAGYLYVGQKQSALTSLCINALFTWAAYHFFHHGNIAAGIITTSLELGWYAGGINGAGLEAREYNTRIYDALGTQTMLQAKLFPVLMLNFGF